MCPGALLKAPGYVDELGLYRCCEGASAAAVAAATPGVALITPAVALIAPAEVEPVAAVLRMPASPAAAVRAAPEVADRPAGVPCAGVPGLAAL